MEATGRPVILATEIRKVVPHARLRSGADLEADQSLVERVEICYPELPAGLWPRARALRWVQIKRAGAESALRDPEAKSHSAVITNTHIHADAIAEHLWGMSLALSRNINKAILRQRERCWDKSAVLPGISTFAGKTACVVGLGSIGRRCGQIDGRR